MSVKHRGELVSLLRENSLPLIAVEVGVAQGLFSEELLSNGVERLYLIDLWEFTPCIEGCASFNEEWHESNYKRVTDLFGKDERVIILKGFSHKESKYVPDGVGLVYIDAGHDYQSVKSDIQVWYPKLVKGGILAFHDFNDQYGVKRALIEFMQGEKDIYIIPEDGSQENRGAYIIKQ